MRRASLLAEEVFVSSNARRGSIFAARIKEEDPHALSIAKVHLLAALTFVLGSVFFVYGDGAEDWLLQYRIGCGFYIIGCVAYLVAMSMSRDIHEGASNEVSDFLIWTAMILFIIGCSLAFSPGVTLTGKRMAIMNWVFLIGSLILLFDAFKCAFSAWMSEGLTLGNYLDIVTTVFFMLAAIMGGGFYCPPIVYKITPLVIKEGMMCWLVGSLFCLIAPAQVVVYGPPPTPSLPMSTNDHYGAVQAAIRNMPARKSDDNDSDSFASSSEDEDSSSGLGSDRLRAAASA